MMKSNVKYLTWTYLLMLGVMFILPYFSAENYSIVKHTTSQLGAQNTPNSWIMNITFIALGISTFIAGWNFLKEYTFQKVLLAVFSLSLILTAIYHHAPIENVTNYRVKEDELHSLFATITGLSFTIFAISTAFILRHRTDSLLSMGVGILATALSLLMFMVDDVMGIWQRLIFVSTFGWMIYIFRHQEKLR